MPNLPTTPTTQATYDLAARIYATLVAQRALGGMFSIDAAASDAKTAMDAARVFMNTRDAPRK